MWKISRVLTSLPNSNACGWWRERRVARLWRSNSTRSLSAGGELRWVARPPPGNRSTSGRFLIMFKDIILDKNNSGTLRCSYRQGCFNCFGISTYEIFDLCEWVCLWVCVCVLFVYVYVCWFCVWAVCLCGFWVCLWTPLHGDEINP